MAEERGGWRGRMDPPFLERKVHLSFFVNEEKNLFKNFNFENLQLLRL